MKVELFNYALPEERIAQRPLAERGQSRLLVLERATGARTHTMFAKVGEFLPPKPVLVLNDTRVIPARLEGKREGTGGHVEVLLLERMGAELDPFAAPAPPVSGARWGRWRALVTASKKIREGLVIELAAGARARVVARAADDEGIWEVDLDGEGDAAAGLASIGAAPLPPYIRRLPDAQDDTRYQTVFARRAGAVAAPTAGLHFTPEHLDRLRAAGAEVVTVTLHVGAGTFLPVRVDDTDAHRMHVERFDVPEATAAAIARARADHRPVVAVGTTSLRALESAANDDRTVRAGSGSTGLFITPGYQFRVVDALLTNFHAPRSTLLMLVSAFAGLDAIRTAYAEALEKEYRFLSYGDAMLIR